MKMKSISGITCYVKDLQKTIEFYTQLGFEFRKHGDGVSTAYLNWFWIDFVDVSNEEKAKFLKEANLEPRGAGMFININVEDVDDYYQKVVEAKMEPSSEPTDWPWGRREFVLRDPDGYKLVFFSKNNFL